MFGKRKDVGEASEGGREGNRRKRTKGSGTGRTNKGGIRQLVLKSRSKLMPPVGTAHLVLLDGFHIVAKLGKPLPGQQQKAPLPAVTPEVERDGRSCEQHWKFPFFTAAAEK